MRMGLLVHSQAFVGRGGARLAGHGGEGARIQPPIPLSAPRWNRCDTQSPADPLRRNPARGGSSFRGSALAAGPAEIGRGDWLRAPALDAAAGRVSAHVGSAAGARAGKGAGQASRRPRREYQSGSGPTLGAARALGLFPRAPVPVLSCRVSDELLLGGGASGLLLPLRGSGPPAG